MAANVSLRATRRGLTLLELILALSLSVLVLMSIGMAIDLHYRMLDVRRTNVEESQLARAALRHMADDLRSAVQYVPPDLTGLDAMSENMSGALSSMAAAASGLSGQPGGLGGVGQSGSGGQAGTGQGDTGQTQQSSEGQSGQSGSGSTAGGGQTAARGGTGSTTGNASTSAAGGISSTSAEGETETETTTTSAVKLYGSATELRLDVSRLPRVDQYQAVMNDSLGAVEIPSDVKTVVYFVRDADSFGSPEPSLDGTGQGLMRSEIDRAAASYAESGGDITSLYASGKLVADEVTGLAFQYWDGVEWLPEWNSDDSGGLPLAVEIVMTIQPTRAMTEEEIADVGLASKTVPPAEQTYRLVVHLPTAISTETRTLELEAADIAATTILPSQESGTQTADSGSQSDSGNNSGGVGTGGVGTGGVGIGGGGGGNDRGGRGGDRDGDRGGGRGGERGGRRNGDRPGGRGNPGPGPVRPPGPGPGPGPGPQFGPMR